MFDELFSSCFRALAVFEELLPSRVCALTGINLSLWPFISFRRVNILLIIFLW